MPTRLSAANGRVAWVTEHRYGVKFGLSGDPRTFDYPSKAGGNGRVREALSSAATQPVDIRFNPEPRRPLLADGDVFDAWEITAGGQVVRSWAESAEGWRSDNAVRPWLAAMFALCTACFAVHAWRRGRVA